MKEMLQQRLASLQSEYEAGQQMLADLDAKRNNLTTKLLQIQGAMMVLKELIEQQSATTEAGPPASTSGAQPT